MGSKFKYGDEVVVSGHYGKIKSIRKDGQRYYCTVKFENNYLIPPEMEYDQDYIEAAFEALERQDAVLGPAADGGYVLIGLKRAEASLFTDVPWGTADVLEATRERLRRLQWRWQELDIKQDVDEPRDLRLFPHLTDDPSDWPTDC